MNKSKESEDVFLHPIVSSTKDELSFRFTVVPFKILSVSYPKPLLK
jgi:hypothetical protein